jgi:hypothetical protein
MKRSAGASRTRRMLLVALSILVVAHRLPAPIVESEEKPTPAAEETAKPKAKRTSRPKHSSSDDSENSGTQQARTTTSPTPPQNPFEGTWAGTLNNLPFTGDVQFTLSVTAGGTAVTENSINFGTHSFQVNCDGTTMKWETGSSWTLTPTADRSTALVTCSNPGFFGFGAFSLSTVFRRIAAAPQTTTATIAARPNDKRNSLPTAKPVPGKPGFVYNPFDTSSKILLDVRGKASGAKVKDPFSGQLFIVP